MLRQLAIAQSYHAVDYYLPIMCLKEVIEINLPFF